VARRKFTKEEQLSIIDLYISDKVHSLLAVAKIYSCSSGMIRNLLLANQIKIRQQSEAQTKRDAINKEDRIRFRKKINIKGKDECWEWQAAVDSCGYGRFGFRKELLSAHRFAWIIAFGEIPSGIHVLHSCDNPPCCNPCHLFLGSHQDNMADRNNKGRSNGGSKSGEDNPACRYTNKDILKIREMLRKGHTQREVAFMFNTIQLIISAIHLRKYWKHI